MWTGMSWLRQSTSRAPVWSVCSWVRKMASISSIDEPTAVSARQSARADRPASMRMFAPPARMSTALPREPEYKAQM